MRLVRVGVHGYKRFGRRTEMRVDGRVIAVVGPNEAGKTSLLTALSRLSDSDAFSRGEQTRGQPLPDEVVWARYLIEDEDRAEMGAARDFSAARWYVAWKDLDGALFHRIEPKGALVRDRAPRRRASETLRRVAENRLLRESERDEHAELLARLGPLATTLESAGESLDDEVQAALGDVVEALGETELPDRSPKYVRDLRDQLMRLREHEAAEHPETTALGVLSGRAPQFLLFGDAERDLRSDYELTEVADPPPAALSHLAELADLNLRSLRDASTAENYAHVEHLLEQANQRLQDVFRSSWRQSGVYPRLRTDGTVLHVFVSAQGGGGYTDVAERSDGLRAFIALLTFTALRARRVAPILLIDEAENHLHYDAQADLVRVFTQQRAAAKIIYTTHSAGCLPEDLAGVRLVAGDEGEPSFVRNAFWTEGVGFTPLLIGMGASLTAFATPRRAVFAEGGADVVLLPTLFRAAANAEEVGFQVAAGLSEVPLGGVPSLDLEAARVAYFVDGDSGGATIRRKLKKAGVDDRLIVVLGGEKSGLVVEDMLRREVYVRAVNAELARSHGEGARITANDVGDKDRPGKVRSWCQQNGLAEPNKTAVAYQVLEISADGETIVARDRKAMVKAAYAKFVSLLDGTRD